MLLFGVLIFSFIMGEYGALLDEYKTSNEEYEEGDKLKLFFGVMRNFNDNEEIKLTMQQDIEKYFTHRWEHYKNLAFQADDEVALLNELPDGVKNDLFSTFLFESFIKVFH